MEIRHNERAGLLSLGLDRATRDALATYVKIRWPSGTAKAAAREWDLSLDEARGLVAGRTSLATVDRIVKHPKGGWTVILPVFGAVVGKPLHEHLRAEITLVQHQQQELEAHARLAEVAHRRLSFPRPLRGGPAGDAARPDRPPGEGGNADGAVGADETRRLG